MVFTNIVDRRKNGKNKSVVNRNRFIQRSKESIKKRVDEIIKDRDIKDIGSGDKITIPKKGINEPAFRNGKGGERDYVLPGNRDKSVGDSIEKEKSGSGGNGPKASNNGDGEDDFSFNITREEFLDFFFEDLELPDLVKTQLKEVEKFKMKRTGHQTSGAPNNLNIVRSMRNALGRRIALKSPFEKEIKKLTNELETANKKRTDEIITEIEILKRKSNAVPFIDEFDLKYNSFTKDPIPSSKAVMFCLMDVSGSMGEYEKDLAKRFFMLLYLFLERKYKKIEIVFIRHTTVAKEVDEQEFFYSKESGGTIVSSAIELAADIIQNRYPTSDWNIYVSQASDGDNWNDDSEKCVKLINEKIMPFSQYFAYIQVAHDPDSNWGSGEELWGSYNKYSATNKQFVAKRINEPNEIYPVFRELFTKDA